MNEKVKTRPFKNKLNKKNKKLIKTIFKLKFIER